jgi:hypothetical protein
MHAQVLLIYNSNERHSIKTVHYDVVNLFIEFVKDLCSECKVLSDTSAFMVTSHQEEVIWKVQLPNYLVMEFILTFIENTSIRHSKEKMPLST